MKKRKVLCTFGTRPEVIKMAPVIRALQGDHALDLRILSTAQHREMLDQMLDIFQILPDIDLDIMKKNQTLPQLTRMLPLPLDRTLKREKPDLVLAQGDTTTVFMMGLACFYQKIPFGHVEAGLRTWQPHDPFPEEMNRLLISRLATLNFAPTEKAKGNLIAEGYPENRIFVTGNTIIDSLHYILKKDLQLDPRIDKDKRLIVVTAHRRENFGSKLRQICKALKKIAAKNPDVQILYPVHPNPNIHKVAHKYLADDPQILLTEPLPYDAFIASLRHAYLILSDSGGIQEEATGLGVPALVMRETTERPEALEVGTCRLVGTDCSHIVTSVQRLLDDAQEHNTMITHQCPYGDGESAKRIVSVIKSFFSDS